MSDPDSDVKVPEDLIEEIHYLLHMFDNDVSKSRAGQHLIELFNAVSDLTSYHSGLDEHGRLPWQRDDDES